MAVPEDCTVERFEALCCIRNKTLKVLSCQIVVPNTVKASWNVSKVLPHCSRQRLREGDKRRRKRYSGGLHRFFCWSGSQGQARLLGERSAVDPMVPTRSYPSRI